MHVIPQLRKLEAKYAAELVVVHVHSAKFPTEKETENVRQAAMRYDMRAPVVNDAGFQIWQRYGIRAWPTLVLIDPLGKVIGKHEGEMPPEVFDRVLAEATQQFIAQGLLDRSPLPLSVDMGQATGPLAFPGKVLADGSSGHLYVSDSNHDRIIAASLDGAVQAVIGSGETGLADGDFTHARFNRPQGLALLGSRLYVADTESHAVRAVDLEAGKVKTVAGTGAQATAFHTGGPGPSVTLSSPWDLTVLGDSLYVAMAGLHQLWRLRLADGYIAPWAGSGQEGLSDGPLQSSWLAQPSGITTDGACLYFADSETSSIRVAEIAGNGGVRTVVGQDLFVFGDEDGVGDGVRLQHPLGVCYSAGLLYIADTYNHKIKIVNPATGAARTLLGTGEPGFENGSGAKARFREPGGLSGANGRLFIADTNNHVVRVADLAEGVVSTLVLRGL